MDMKKLVDENRGAIVRLEYGQSLGTLFDAMTRVPALRDSFFGDAEFSGGVLVLKVYSPDFAPVLEEAKYQEIIRIDGKERTNEPQ